MNKKDVVKYYLNNLIKCKLPSKTTESLLEYFEDVSKDILGFDICDKWGRTGRLRLRHRVLDENDDDSQPEYQRNVQTLRHVLGNQKIVDISVPGSDKCTDCLAELFDISKTERQILQLFVNLTRFRTVRTLVNEIIDSHRFNSGFNLNNIGLIAAFCDLSESKIRKALDEDGTLVNAGLLIIDEDGDLAMNGFIQRSIANCPQSVEKLKKILLGDVHHGNKGLDFSHVQNEYDYIKSLVDNAVKHKSTGINILIYGQTGTGKTEMTKQIVSELGYDLYGLHTSNKTRQEKNVNLSYLMHAQRILVKDTSSVVLLDEAEDLFTYNKFNTNAVSKLSLNQLLERNKRPVIWTTNDINSMDRAYLRRFTYCLELKKPEENQKIQIWQNICKQHKYKMSATDIKKYAKKYDVAPGLIDTAVKSAKLTKNQDAIEKTIDSLCVAITGKKQIEAPKADVEFDAELLNTDVDMMKLTQQILGGKCKNFSLCLYGASGTGKSAYARYLAEKMGMKVIFKRASDLKSMWVGETEKNIAAAFAQAASEKAMLIFDEADSFLRDRSKANASWEISGVNEMLTQMESATVPFVCTTNLMNDMDSASLRRFLFKIKYDYMTPNQVQRAFRHFFGLCPDDSDIRNLSHLTPGDFVVAKRKAEILGISELAPIVDLLRAEMNVKKDAKKTNKIGF